MIQMIIALHHCLGQHFMKPSSTVLKECRTLENTNVYPKISKVYLPGNATLLSQDY